MLALCAGVRSASLMPSSASSSLPAMARRASASTSLIACRLTCPLPVLARAMSSRTSVASSDAVSFGGDDAGESALHGELVEFGVAVCS